MAGRAESGGAWSRKSWGDGWAGLAAPPPDAARPAPLFGHMKKIAYFLEKTDN
jgi:hypothetical protein